MSIRKTIATIFPIQEARQIVSDLNLKGGYYYEVKLCPLRKGFATVDVYDGNYVIGSL